MNFSLHNRVHTASVVPGVDTPRLKLSKRRPRADVKITYLDQLLFFPIRFHVVILELRDKFNLIFLFLEQVNFTIIPFNQPSFKSWLITFLEDL